jgi:hypothetical protein
VFEFKEKDVPKLVYAGWPTGLEKYNQTPVWMFWRPGMRQGTFRGIYPHSLDYYVKCFTVNLFYFNNTPLDRPVFKGLLYQLHHARKDALMIMPMPYHPPRGKNDDFGSFMKAATTQAVIEDIIGYCQRVQAKYVKPQIGYMVFSSFSSGNNKLSRFLQENRNEKLLSSCIKEVYAVDPPKDRYTENAMRSIMAWQNRDNDRVGRIYSYKGFDFFKDFLGYSISTRLGFHVNASGNRSVMIAPNGKWRDAYTGIASQYSTFQIRHHGHCSMLHTDALRRSKLPDK